MTGLRVFLAVFWLVLSFASFFMVFGILSWITGTPFQLGPAIALSVAIGGGLAFSSIRSAQRDPGDEES